MPATEKTRRKSLARPLGIAADERAEAFFCLALASDARARQAVRDRWTDPGDVRALLAAARACQSRSESAGFRLP